MTIRIDFLRLLSSLVIIFYGIGRLQKWENPEPLLMLSLILAVQAVAVAVKERRL